MDATVPLASTYRPLRRVPRMPNPSLDSQPRTAATLAALGPYVLSNWAFVSHLPYCAEPGVVSAWTCAAAWSACDIFSSTPKSTSVEAAVRPNACALCNQRGVLFGTTFGAAAADADGTSAARASAEPTAAVPAMIFRRLLRDACMLPPGKGWTRSTCSA